MGELRPVDPKEDGKADSLRVGVNEPLPLTSPVRD